MGYGDFQIRIFPLVLRFVVKPRLARRASGSDYRHNVGHLLILARGESKNSSSPIGFLFRPPLRLVPPAQGRHRSKQQQTQSDPTAISRKKRTSDSGSVEPDALRICSAAVSAEPCVPAVLDKPVLDERSASGSSRTVRRTRAPSVCQARSDPSSGFGPRSACSRIRRRWPGGPSHRRRHERDFAAAVIVCSLRREINGCASFHRGESRRTSTADL